MILRKKKAKENKIQEEALIMLLRITIIMLITIVRITRTRRRSVN